MFKNSLYACFLVLLCAFAAGCGGESRGKSKTENPLPVIDPNNPLAAFVSYTANNFKENQAVQGDGGQGTFQESIIATLANDSFSPSTGSILSLGSDFNVIGDLPDGLGIKLTVTAVNQLTIQLDQAAIDHEASDSIFDLKLQLNASVFESEELPPNTSATLTFSIIFYSQVNNAPNSVLTYNPAAPTVKVFNEDLSNGGTGFGTFLTNDIIEIELVADTFVYSDGSTLNAGGDYSVTGMPANGSLDMAISVAAGSNKTKLQVRLIGQAANHTQSNDVNGVSVTLSSGIFSSGFLPANGNPTFTFDIKFNPDFTISYAGSLPQVGNKYLIKEIASVSSMQSVGNIGQVDGAVDVSLVGGQFNQGANFIEGTHYQIIGSIPPGLDMNFNHSSATDADLYFELDPATNHQVSNNTDVTITFLAPAFIGTPPANNKSFTLTFEFINNPSLSWDDTFIESRHLNNGTFKNNNSNSLQVLDVDLTGDTFSASVNSFMNENVHYKIINNTNEPVNTVLNVKVVANNKLALTLVGTTNQHDYDDAADFTVELLPTAFTSYSRPVNGSEIQDINVIYRADQMYLYSLPPLYDTALNSIFATLHNRADVDAECFAKRGSVNLPHIRGFITFSASDQIADFPFLANNPVPTDVPIRSRSNDRTIANDWNDLTDGSIDIPLDPGPAPQHLGASILQPGVLWLSGSAHNGELNLVSANTGANCNGWTSTAPNDVGVVGSSSTTNGSWIYKTPTTSCSSISNVSILCIGHD